MSTTHHDIASQNRLAAHSGLTSGELYLAILNRDLESVLAAAADRHEQKTVAARSSSEAVAQTSFSSGAGACQVREWEGGAA